MVSTCAGQQVKENRQDPIVSKVEPKKRTVEKDFPTPLSRAIVMRQISVVQFLLLNGADANGVDHSDYVRIPILVAADVGDLEILRMLLHAGARIEAKNDSGLTALMIATLRGNVKTVEFLLTKGADVNARTDACASALMTAARDGQLAIVRVLLRAGADVNLAADGDVTALMVAGDDPDTVEALLEASAKMEVPDKRGWTAVCYAKENKQPKKLATLIRYGANDKPQCSGYPKVSP